MTPTWYDILGVTPEATPEEIKAAWRNATDKFEPGTGGSQFRMFNEAADVLLDPEKKAAYDAELAGDSTPEAATPDVEPVETTATDEPAPTPDVEPAETTATDEPPVSPDVEPVETPATDEPAAADEPAPESKPKRTIPGLAALTSTLGLAVTAVLAVAALVLALVLGINLNHRVNNAADSADSYSAGLGAEASSVAERAVQAVLAYNYTNMNASRDAATKFLTPSYKKTYEKIFDGLINGTEASPGGAVKTKAVVTADVLSTSIVNAERNRVQVLVFVNQTPVLDGKKGQLLANRVVATMVKVNGSWLLDKLDPLSAGF